MIVRRLASGLSLGVRYLLQNYLPVLFFLLIATMIGIVALGAGRIIAPSRPNAEKNSPYECGFEAFEDARIKFDVRYYLVAILFIIFDLEIAFIVPWAIVLDNLALSGFIAMAIFLAELLVGLVYAWKKGALEWE